MSKATRNIEETQEHFEQTEVILDSPCACVEYMAEQLSVMQAISRKIADLDNNRVDLANHRENYEYRSNLLINYQYHAQEHMRAYVQYGVLTTPICSTHKFHLNKAA